MPTTNKSESESLKKRNVSSTSTSSSSTAVSPVKSKTSTGKDKHVTGNRVLEKLLEEGGEDEDEDEEYSSDEDLPYRGKVYLARRKKPDSWPCIAFQVFLIAGVVVFAYYAYYYYEHMNVHVLKAYAHMGFDSAQFELANRYLHGAGVETHHEKAMEWYKKAADQGHVHSAYNLGVGHLKGMRTPIDRTEALRLIEHAAKNDVPEAAETLANICMHEGC